MDNRTLDKEIAEKFLSWHDVQWESVGNNQVLRGWKPPAYTSRTGIPYYSTDPKACVLVLDEFERRGWYWEWSHKWDSCFVAIYDLNGSPDRPLRMYGKAWHDNRYRAVCEAALQTIKTEQE